MADFLTIRGLIERVLSGTVRIPKFQRGFVWESDKVAFLMDSIYRGYPIGSVLLWRSEQKLNGERDLGPFELPEPEKQLPIDYVLDGQQRITSLFGVFQNTLLPKEGADSFDVYFDLQAPEGALEDQFVVLSKDKTIGSGYFSLRLLFDPSSFAQKTRELNDADLNRVVELQRRFQEFQIKSDVIEFKEREQIAMIFERVNRAGVPLDTFQLLTAWTWSDDFDLTERIEQLGAEVAPYGFSRIGEEQDLLMKCCAAIVDGDASVKSIIGLHGPTVRDQFETIQRAILGAIEFLQKELNVHSLEILPYPAMLIPLSRFFKTASNSGYHPTVKQRRQLIRWFWASCFTRRYSSGVGKAQSADIEWMDALRADDNTPFHIHGAIDPFFFTSTFNIGTVNTKIFVLMLAAMKPRSLISGARVDLSDVLLRCNRNEFHHVFPKAFLQRTLPQSIGQDRINHLSNFCFLSSSDNQKIKDKSPVEYVKMIASTDREKIFGKAFLFEGWHKLDYFAFTYKRADLLSERASTISGLAPGNPKLFELFGETLSKAYSK